MNRVSRNLLLTATFLLAIPLSADQRWYVWTYEYKTVRRGGAEFEGYLTLSSPNFRDRKGATAAEHRFELEIGMTDRFDFAIYQVFRQEPEDALSYKGTKLRARYRLGEKGMYILDPLAYAEYKVNPDLSDHSIELKLILARDMGRYNMSINPVLEFEKEDRWQYESAYAVGVSYEMSKMLRVGLESMGGESGNYVGPVIAHGAEGLWVTLGGGFGIGDVAADAPGFQLRLLMGIGL